MGMVMGTGDQHVKSSLEIQMENSARVPGPGAYESTPGRVASPLHPATLRAPTRAVATGNHTAHRQAPRARVRMCAGFSTLRSKGSPRFKQPCGTGGQSMIEAIQEAARRVPGPVSTRARSRLTPSAYSARRVADVR